MNYQQQKMYDDYLKAQKIAEDQSALMNEAFSDSTPQEGSAPEAATQVSGVIGRIAIDRIDCDLLLLEGSSSRELRYGAGHLDGTALPGQKGNCAIAGHRNYTFGTYFNRLDEMKNDDPIAITYEDHTYTYLVYDSFTVLPDDISVLEQPDDDSIITLITCAPKGSNTHRLIVRARLQSD